MKTHTDIPPFFSIIIPVYNVQAYIAKCLDSVINQTFRDIEIIIVDDCGSDRSLEIVKGYATRDPRIKIIHNPRNLGTFHARLEGIKNASGKYCLFVDSDDFIKLETCEILHLKLQENPSIDLLHFGMSHDPNKWYFPSPLVHQGRLQQEKMQQFLICNSTFQSLCDKAIKTSSLKHSYAQLLFITPPLNMMEDGIVILVLSFEIKIYEGISDKLYFYRHNPQSMTRSISPDAFQKKFQDFKKLFSICEHIQTLYPQYTHLIQKYTYKIASATILSSRHYSPIELEQILTLLKSNNLNKSTLPLPTYLASCLLSMKYFYRWQTLARIAAYILSFGKIKL
ncbi:glycosyltransferase family 2 protein [Helicobacter pametensis]|uniref:glycosyltransferase family 2 protein n=1 Tax=Helicobacter pametensis TaxID=95149 RepID=UPI0004B82A14|nr:glycosyltransferase family 2 protein [Helicobacter pametensis]